MSILLDKRDDLAEPYPAPDSEYPESDGKPMADNTLQYEWIVIIKEGIENLFADAPDVFVAADLLWYPVQENNKIRQAPDVMVAFGRPKGYRGSYQQWIEADTAPQVVFEILSPGNRAGEMASKAAFYDRHGVEEYYIYDPDRVAFTALVRSVITGMLEEVPLPDSGYISPRLGVRFDRTRDTLVIYRADGEPFKSYTQIFAERETQRIRAEAAEAGRKQVAAERDAETARANAATAERDAATARAERLAARLREAGIEPD